MFDVSSLMHLSKQEQYQQLAQQARVLMEGEKDGAGDARLA